MPGLVYDGPGRVVMALAIAKKNREQRHSWQKAAAPELQYTAAIPTSPFRCHD